MLPLMLTKGQLKENIINYFCYYTILVLMLSWKRKKKKKKEITVRCKVVVVVRRSKQEKDIKLINEHKDLINY